MDREFMTDDDLRGKLEEFFKSTTMTQRAVIDHMDLHYNTLWSFRKGTFNPSRRTRNKIFNFLEEREKRVDD